jgi:predicted CXXCH cytochrome family protein
VSFVLQRVTGQGLVLSQINLDSLRIGRGTSAELRSENPAVALEHAVIEEDAAGFSITDKGSITGTYVNRKPVESARLTRGDVIEIGDLRIEVQIADPGRPLFLRLVPTATSGSFLAVDEEEEQRTGEIEPLSGGASGGKSGVVAGGTVRAPVVDYSAKYRLRRPWLTRLSVTALAAIVVLTLATELTLPEQQTAFMPGGVSSAHFRARVGDKPIANNCRACHTPFEGVRDEQCRVCHVKAPHAENVRDEPACMSCHAEHRGAVKLSQIGDKTCLSCHGNLAAHTRHPGLVPLNIRDLGPGHPEFSPVADTDTLRFNHKLHLAKGGIFNAAGRREVLACATCHKLTADTHGKLDPKPVRFATNCQRCHKLTFDIRYPDVELPHGGDPDIVYGAVIAAHSGSRGLAEKSPDEIRRILTARSQIATDESVLVDAAHVIKTKCAQCHEIRTAGKRQAVTPPVIPTRWLFGAKFSHGPHRTQDCENCHATARGSSLTTQVLVPVRGACVACHGSEAAGNSRSCVTCHDYHERSKNLLAKAPAVAAAVSGQAGDETGMLGTILLYAIVVLLVIMLVPLGLATYQRLKPRREERPRQRAAPAPVPPTAKMAAIVTPVPPAAAPPVAPPAPPVAAPAPPPPSSTPSNLDVTRVGPIGSPAEGGATEAVEWYGMIHWTSGPLEGQRMVIEAKGLYVGRDPGLADLVIADSRVSKRHLRIVPRDGRAHAIDQGSTNGTYLASNPGVRITDIQLKRGDTIIFGDGAASFVYQI